MKNFTFLFKSVILLFCLSIPLTSHAQVVKGAHNIDKQTKKEIYAVLDAYLDGFNKRDAKIHYATYHFPHYRLASGKLTVLETAADSVKFSKGLVQSDWHHSKWDHRNVVQASADKVHVDTRFTRYRADGSVIATYESLYVLTKEDGRWGIKLRSSFAE